MRRMHDVNSAPPPPPPALRMGLTVTVLAVMAGLLLSFPACSLCVSAAVYSARACSATVLGPL